MTFRAPSPLVPLEHPRFKVDLKYASTDNFMKKDMYGRFGITQAYALPALRDALLKIVPSLERERLCLLIFDTYRPPQVQQEMWDRFPDENFLAHPAKGSNHSRGAAVDLSLADEQGREIPMPTEFDAFTPRAAHGFRLEPHEKHLEINREKLRTLMTEAGLEGVPSEWWHYQLKGARQLPILTPES
jgi:D-alanyl-D-alanine dipeptidase